MFDCYDLLNKGYKTGFKTSNDAKNVPGSSSYLTGLCSVFSAWVLSELSASTLQRLAMYMIFPVKGSRFNTVNKKLKKHKEIPSSERIFIRPCRTADRKSTFTTTPKPAQIMFTVSKLGLVWVVHQWRHPVEEVLKGSWILLNQLTK